MWKVLFWCALIFAFVNAQVNYCEICPDHTMCEDTFSQPGRACGTDDKWPLTKSEIDQIVEVHNEYRSGIAQGRESSGLPGPQPKAANMHRLVWDENLAKVAQRWADQCTFKHDLCRDDPRFPVGQNIYWTSSSSLVNWTRAIQTWYTEVARMNGTNIARYAYDPHTGHYTQLTWAKTRYVGCGRRIYGGSYHFRHTVQPEYVLSPTQPRKHEQNVVEKESEVYSIEMAREKRQDTGYFGGARFDPAGTQGAIVHPHQMKPTGAKLPTRPNIQTTQKPTNGNEYQWLFPQTIYIPNYSNQRYDPYFYWPRQGFRATSSDTLSHNHFPNVNQLPRTIVLDMTSSTRGYGNMYDMHLMREQILICNYGPAGNIIGEPVYEIGEPCSKCAQDMICLHGTCHEK